MAGFGRGEGGGREGEGDGVRGWGSWLGRMSWGGSVEKSKGSAVVMGLFTKTPRLVLKALSLRDRSRERQFLLRPLED